MTHSHENPLLPHARIRELFRALLDIRKLDDDVATLYTVAASAMPLRDVAMCNLCAPDPALHPALKLALGLTARELVGCAQMAWLQDRLVAQTAEQCYFALGGATACQRPTLLIAGSNTLTARQWTALMTDAVRLQAPVVLLALPGEQPALASFARRSDLTGIAVDSADPIALYRVASESFVRVRAGGGPVLIQAVSLPGAVDALTLLRRQVIEGGAATERWVFEQEVRRRPSGFPKQVH